MKKFIVALIILFAPLQATAAERLCPSIKPNPKHEESMKMSEEEITEKGFLDGIEYFKNYLPEQFKKYKSTSAMTDSEGFWIGYDNSAQFIEGYMLKQDAILEQMRNKQNGTNTHDARDAFCQYISAIHYVD